MFLSVIVAVLLAFLIYYWIHRIIINKTVNKTLDEAQKTTEAALLETIPFMVNAGYVAKQPEHLESEKIANIWGKGVAAFEFELPAGINVKNLDLIKWQTTIELQSYAKQNRLNYLDNAKNAFTVTDIWLKSERLHLDVAFMINEATSEYVSDLNKLE